MSVYGEIKFSCPYSSHQNAKPMLCTKICRIGQHFAKSLPLHTDTTGNVQLQRVWGDCSASNMQFMFFHRESYFIQTVPTLSDIGRPTVQINISPFGSHKQRCVQKSSAPEGPYFVERQPNYRHTRSQTFHVNYPVQRKSYQKTI
jgi:hypothetical protein